MKEVYAGVTAELARLQKDPDARYAYLAMLVSAHQVVKDRWFVEAREALEGGWDDP
jgi:predicted negative regulator of RcsB-dependent stress response